MNRIIYMQSVEKAGTILVLTIAIHIKIFIFLAKQPWIKITVLLLLMDYC